MLRSFAEQGMVELTDGPARGDPEVSFVRRGGQEAKAFELL